MPPSWITLLSAGLKLLGFADLAEKLVNNHLQKQQGRKDQQLDDLKAQGNLDKKLEQAAANAPTTLGEIEDSQRKGEF